MFKRFDKKPSASMVIALLAVVVALGGTAVAASVKMSGDKLIKKGTLSGNRLRKHTLTATQLNLGSLPIAGAGWGRVAANGTLSRAHNASVTRLGDGDYCITVSGVNAATAPMLLTMDFDGDRTGVAGPPPQTQGFAEYLSGSPASCGFEVKTFIQTTDSSHNLTNTQADQAFAFFVP